MIIKLIIAVIALLILGAIIYTIFRNPQQKSQTSDSPVASVAFDSIKIISPKPTPEPLFANLISSGKPAGYVRLSEVAGKVLIQLKSDLPDSNIASIYKGTCKQTGKIVYPLATLKEDKSETIWETNLQAIKTQLPLSIKVFKDTPITPLSCADLIK